MPRVKTHFKVHASIRNHEKMPGVYATDALLAMYVRAGILAVERYASRTGNSFLLAGGDLCEVAQTRPLSNAIRKFERLARDPAALEQNGTGEVSGSPLRLRREGAWWRLDFPNLKRKQGFGRNKGGRTENPSSSDSASTSDSPKKTRAPRRAGQGSLPLSEPKKRAFPAELSRAYEIARTEIAKLKPSSLPEVPSKSALRDLRKLLDRYPDEDPETVITELVRGAVAYWKAANPDAEERTIRARLVLSTLCTERGSDKYREHGREPTSKPPSRTREHVPPPQPSAEAKARADRAGRLLMAIFKRSRRMKPEENKLDRLAAERAFEFGNYSAILELEQKYQIAAPTTGAEEEDCPV